ncbi:MAG: hypothetical protein ILO10_00985 [Kiritimatiellae bacterium]|nr:hypothetical protein [Kiritimatiellia bacterium]
MKFRWYLPNILLFLLTAASLPVFASDLLVSTNSQVDPEELFFDGNMNFAFTLDDAVENSPHFTSYREIAEFRDETAPDFVLLEVEFKLPESRRYLEIIAFQDFSVRIPEGRPIDDDKTEKDDSL